MSKKIFSVIIVSCAVIVSSASLHGQDTAAGDAGTISKSKFVSEPVIITGKRYESSVLKEGKAVTVITEEEIKASGKDDVIQLLETVPGISVSREGTDGGLAYIFMRGASGSNVLIMIDSVKINDPTAPDRRIDLSFIKTGSIERIEVVRGSMSSLYGSEASGGVINIITKTGHGDSLTLKFTGGMYNTFSQSVQVSENGEKKSFFFSGAHYSSTGISSAKDMTNSGNFDDDDTENYTAACKMTGELWNKTSLMFNVNYSDKETDIDAEAGKDDPNYTTLNRLFSTSGDFRHRPFEWWNYRAGVSLVSLDRVSSNPPDSLDATYNVFAYQSSGLHGQFINNFSLPVIGIVSFGLEAITENADISEQFNSSVSFIKDESVTTLSAYIHDSYSYDDIFFINTGLRIDNHSEFGNHYTWDVSGAYVVPFTKTKLRSSIGSAFRSPSLYQLYSDYGNPDLKPETSLVFDGGIYQDIQFSESTLTFEGTCFYQEYKNMIDFLSMKYANIDGSIVIWGFEFSSLLKLSDILSIGYTGTFLNSLKSVNDQPFLRKPKYIHSAEVTIAPLSGFAINASYSFVGPRDDVYFDAMYNPHYVKLDPYHKIDVNIRYEFNTMLTITARGENLTNADYMDTYGYNTYGRSFFGGIELTF